MKDTKEKILDTAEQLFAEQGFDATSLRQIIVKAGVNLAAVHYHFRTKEGLLDAVVNRRVDPINEERLALLDRCLAESDPPSVEGIVRAFLEPVIDRLYDPSSATFVRVMGRLHAEGIQLQRIVTTHFGRVLQRFDAALRLALPDQSETDIAWNVHFSVGAMAHTLRGFPQIHCDMSNRHEVLDRLVAYTSAGFRTVRRRKEEPEHVRP